MNYILDVKTILIVLALGHLLSGVLMIAYVVKNKSDQSINTFLLAKSLELTAWIFIILRGQIPDLLSIAAANYLLIIGSTFQIIAFLMLEDCYDRRIKLVYIALNLSFAVVFTYNTIYHNTESTRVLAISFYIVVLWIYPIFKLIFAKAPSVLKRMIGILYGLAVLSFGGRAFAVLFIDDDMTLISTNTNNVLAFLSLYMVMLIGSIGFILLAKEKSDIELVRAATLDQLTSIYNRGTFISRAKELIALHHRKNRPLSLLLIDLDHFKKINDTYGHQTGDLVLSKFAEEIKGQLRNYDLFGRFGGEEFVLLLPDTLENEAREVAERLRRRIELSPVPLNDQISYTISIGAVAMIPDSSTTVESLFNVCDKALYQAKDNGRNCVEFIQI